MRSLFSTRVILLFLCVGLARLDCFGQSDLALADKPYIEVTGIAEKEVVPDEIYVRIVIRERIVNKEKISIQNQEAKLKESLRAIGIDLSNLYLSDAQADYITIRRKPNEVLTQKEYLVKLTTANQVGQVFQQLDQLEITDAGIQRVNHSRLDSLKKEIKVEAIKAAKAKADYLLAAIGEQTGKALIVQEVDNGPIPMVGLQLQSPRLAEMANVAKMEDVSGTDELQFSKIKLEARIYVKFAIK